MIEAESTALELSYPQQCCRPVGRGNKSPELGLNCPRSLDMGEQLGIEGWPGQKGPSPCSSAPGSLGPCDLLVKEAQRIPACPLDRRYLQPDLPRP